MQVSILFVLVAGLAVTFCGALPVQQDEARDTGLVSLLPLQQHTRDYELHLPEDVDQEALVRQLRSPQKDKSKGTFDVGVHREKGVGTVVQAQADRNVWQSKDGRTRVDASGQWSRVFNGPGAGKPNYSGGIRFSHRF